MAQGTTLVRHGYMPTLRLGLSRIVRPCSSWQETGPQPLGLNFMSVQSSGSHWPHQTQGRTCSYCLQERLPELVLVETKRTAQKKWHLLNYFDQDSTQTQHPRDISKGASTQLATGVAHSECRIWEGSETPSLSNFETLTELPNRREVILSRCGQATISFQVYISIDCGNTISI